MNWSRQNVLVYRQTPPGDQRVNAGVTSPTSATGHVRVGIWDMDTSAGALPRLIDRLNECQQHLSFFTVEAPSQTGVARPGAHVADEWRKRTRGVMSPGAAAVNVSARTILTAAEPVLERLPVDWLIVVVSSMLSDTIDIKNSWHNLFSTSAGHVVLVSTFGLREYAVYGGRPFEAALFGSVLSALLSAMVPTIEYQNETTGSIFDFCVKRDDIVQSIRRPHIDPTNRARIPEAILVPAETLLECLISYEGTVVQARKVVARRPKANTKPKANRRTGQAGASASDVTPASPPSFAAVLKSLEKLAKRR